MASVASRHPRRGSAGSRAVRYARRAAALGLYAAALAVAYVLLSPVLPDFGGGAGNAPAARSASRPATAPARIPSWAWELDRWHGRRPSERGPRPQSAPQPVPGWYWDWRKWRADST